MRYATILGFGLILATSCNQDQKDVTLHGLVYDQNTKQPLSNAVVKIENASYEGGDYDGYNKYDYYSLISDSSGRFSLKLSKSAYVVARISKAGYKQEIVAKHIYTRKPRLIVFLNK